MTNLFQNVNFLEDFATRVLIFDVDFVDALDGDILSGQFMNTESNFTESSFAEKFNEAIKVESGVWDLSMLLDVRLDILDQLFPIFSHRVII